MNAKKSKKAELIHQSELYFLIGLNISLLFIFLILEFSKEETKAIQPYEVPIVPDPKEVIVVENRNPVEPEVKNIEQVKLEVPIEVEPKKNEEELEEPKAIFEDNKEKIQILAQVKSNSLLNPPSKTKLIENIPTDEINDEIDVRTAKNAMIYPGCENYEGDNRQLYKCFNDEFIKDLAHFIDPNFDLDKGEIRKVALSFTIDKDGNLQLTRINGYGAENSFVANASQAFRSLASKMERRNSRGKGIKPAEGPNGKPAVMKYSIPLVFQPPR